MSTLNLHVQRLIRPLLGRTSVEMQFSLDVATRCDKKKKKKKKGNKKNEGVSPETPPNISMSI